MGPIWDSYGIYLFLMELIKLSDLKAIDKSNVDVNNILIDFQCMYDFDESAVRYLVEHAKNVKMLNGGILEASTLSGLRNLMLCRNTENPLRVCISPNYYDSIDDIYKELIEKHEEEILNNCTINNIYSYINTLLKTNNLVKVTVNCENELQANIARQSMLEKANIVINERDLKDYNTLYLKYVSNIIQYTNIVNKRIFFVNALYNFENGMFKNEVLLLINNNIISVIDQYNELTVPAMYNTLINLNDKRSVENDSRNKE